MSKVDYRQQLKLLYTWSAVGYIGLAILAASLMSSVTYQLTLGHLAQDELASSSSAVLVPGAHALYDISIKWVVVVLMVLSAVVPILYLTRWQKRYDQGIKKQFLTWRWVDLGVTSSLIVWVVALLSGLQEAASLKMLVGLVLISFALGWLAERQAIETKKSIMPTFIIGFVAGCLPWLLIATYAVATPFYTSVRAPWFVYALYVSSFGAFLLLAYNQWRQHQKYKQWKDYLFVERNYTVIAILAKAAFALILIVGLKK